MADLRKAGCAAYPVICASSPRSSCTCKIEADIRRALKPPLL